MRNLATSLSLGLTLYVMFLPTNAHAYLDPNMVNFGYQILAAGVTGLVVGFTFFKDTLAALLARMSGLFRRK